MFDREYTEMIEKTELSELCEAVNRVLCTLSIKEEKVIKLRFGFYGREYTLEDVGSHFNVTRERIRQIESKAVRKLHHKSRSVKLKSHWDD